ncbi:MAG: helix-turn-helix transcriptional regulator [Erysipelotrichaceae bacterium]|nr:helix-turn-helix transcriptional regulator [Erysipelotrichaceae bacterium]
MSKRNYNDLKKDLMKDSEFKKEYDALETEFSLIEALLDARIASGMTQKELSGRSGVLQANISKIENGEYNPSVAVLRRLADAMDMDLKITFVPRRNETI